MSLHKTIAVCWKTHRHCLVSTKTWPLGRAGWVRLFGCSSTFLTLNILVYMCVAHTCVFTATYQLLLENGILITFVLSKCSGDVEQILIDRSLLPRLQASIDNGEFWALHKFFPYCFSSILIAVFSGSNILLTVKEDPRPACVSLSYHRSSAAQVSLTLRKTDSGRRLEKLSSQDPKVIYYALVINNYDVYMLSWW